ncbi:MAG TPA: prepilin peptidase [Xanthomonadales bacterium]|nr:prepilin peptidase [Xanthomonadales bacterium]
MTAATIVLLVATLAAAVTDVRTRRIPNVLTAATAVSAVAVHLFDGIGPELAAIAVMTAAFAIGSFAYSAGWFGGGDVKLIAACCGLVGFPAAIPFALDVLVAGGVLALVAAAANGRLVALVRSTATVAVRGAATEKTTLPYGVAIAAGSIAYALVPTLR